MESTGKKKVALFFGSFNPIHEGHIAVARFIRDKHPEVELRFVVSPESPFKSGLFDSANERLEFVRKKVSESLPGVEVSDVEFSLPRPHYTINTLRHLRGDNPDTDFILVVGGDNIASIESWHEGAAILKEFEVWVYPRDGYDARSICRSYDVLESVKGVKLLEGELYKISSTEIRAQHEFDVIIIGGGITGAGTARDCSMRGLKTLLIEKGDFTNGATGRNHGLLHSGARYAVNDTESARECIVENKIIRKIAPHCVDETGGLFISLPEDGIEYQKKFLQSCSEAGIEAEAIDPKEVLAQEPAVNPDIIGAVRVPDCSVDPFRLTIANIIDAKKHGAICMTDTTVTGFVKDHNRIVGVKTRGVSNDVLHTFYSKIVVNAAGIWGASIAEMAGARISMYPAKGSLLVFGHRITQKVINRCRKSGDADILVPGGTVSIIGTTSSKVPLDMVDDIRTTAEEVDLLLSEGSKLVPSLKETRILRAYAGVRPLVAADDDPSGRNISRGIVLLDHAQRDGVEGFITITGGKLTTYRQMAEMATDLVCKYLNVNEKCMTALNLLPNPLVREARFGGKLVCECEYVTEEDIMEAVSSLEAHDLDSLRRRTRLGMGTCQGQLCARRAASMLNSPDIKGFIDERWKGIYPIAWGDALREAQLSQWIYAKKNEI